MQKAVFPLILAVFLAACAAPGAEQQGMHAEKQEEAKITKHYEESFFQLSEGGLFGVEMLVPDKGLVMGLNNVDIIVHDRHDRDVPGAEITVTPWMPGMGHGVPEKPMVMERGGGLYTVGNIKLSMTGHWELKIHIKKGSLEDTVVFDFPSVGAMGQGHMMHSAPAEMEMPASSISENSVFRVSYESSRMPVPIGRIHIWTLTVQTADGKPVEGARITVSGDMPEHGHGMPTQPEVTRELEGGKYVLEGMRFSMPGFWVVTLQIKAGDLEDSVRFNLNIR